MGNQLQIVPIKYYLDLPLFTHLLVPIEMQKDGDGFGLENSSICVSETFEYR